jgi:YD repeat-containing protein
MSAPACTNVQSGAILPAGRLLCVSDNFGNSLQFEYNEIGTIGKVIDLAGQVTLYEYGGEAGGCSGSMLAKDCLEKNVLTKVTYPDGKSRTYLYNERAQINAGEACAGKDNVSDTRGAIPKALTGIIDENGDRHLTWTYNCQGLASSSSVGQGTEKVDIAYGPLKNDRVLSGNFTNTVTHFTGTVEAPVASVTNWIYEKTAYGVALLAEIDKDCRECGGAGRKRRDENGNTTSQIDWGMNSIESQFDTSRNLEISRTVSGLVPKITKTIWHAQYRLPLKLSEPKKRTSYTYDAKGNVLTRTEQATSDETGGKGFDAVALGAPRVWTYTYTANSQLWTVKGPRTDVVDLTTYTYNAQGNLLTITDALKRTTTFSDYDAHGNALTMVAPNGLRTTTTYTPRGWLETQTVTDGTAALRTSYDYDGAGQLKTVTMPNRQVITYTYDEAHRLTGIADNAGSSIHYTLDLVGNPIRQEVKDPNGVLARQTSRVFDAMSRLQQVTGAAQ